MSNDEGKFLLNAYRPSGRDAGDPAFATALEQAKTDPALGTWFAREQAHASVMAAKLRTITPPPGLREAILAGGNATERVSVRQRRWTPAVWFAIAASFVALAAGSMAFWPKQNAQAAELTAFALNDVVHGRHGGHGAPEKALQAHLGEADAHLATGVPVDFAQLEKSGCRTLSVAGHNVLEVCFVRNGTEFHCYIGRAKDFPETGADDGMTYIQRAGLAAAAWTKGAYRYVVVGDAGLDAVKRLL